MSGDPRDYYSSSRRDERGLPSLREIVGDALDYTPASSRRSDFRDVDRSLPRSSNYYGRYPSPQAGGYIPERGPTLPPIRNLPPPRSQSSLGHREREKSVEPPRYKPPQPLPRQPPCGHPRPPMPTFEPPPSGPIPYSYNVLRTQQGDLVDVRTPSKRAQGILRPTAIIDDEDESHKRYKCTWEGCDKKYDRPSSLEVHINTHTGQQPFPCPFPGCPRAFNVKSNMLRHFRSHGKGKGKSPQASGERHTQDSDDDEDDERSKWPQESSGRYFHTAVTTTSITAVTSPAAATRSSYR